MTHGSFYQQVAEERDRATDARLKQEELDRVREFCVKSVPDAEPNAVGTWVRVKATGHTLRDRDMYALLSGLLPPGHHAVSLNFDTRLAGRPGDYVLTSSRVHKNV